MNQRWGIWWLYLAALAGVACATSQSRFSFLGDSYPPKPSTAEVEVFETGLPSRTYERISRIDVHLEKTQFISSTLAEALPELRRQARLSGADAIIELREKRSMIGETRVYHLTGIGIRYTAE